MPSVVGHCGLCIVVLRHVYSVKCAVKSMHRGAASLAAAHVENVPGTPGCCGTTQVQVAILAKLGCTQVHRAPLGADMAAG